jgi:subtilisin family serine protease
LLPIEMSKYRFILKLCAIAALLVGWVLNNAVAGVVDPTLAARIKRDKTTKYVQVLVDVADAGTVNDATNLIASLPRKERPAILVKFLKERRKISHEIIAQAVSALGGREIHSLWLSGKLAASIPIDAVEKTAQLANVTRVSTDVILQAPIDRLSVYRPTGTMRRDRLMGRTTDTEKISATEISLKQVEKTILADHVVEMNMLAAWEEGFRGQGVTVAILDTGIDPINAGLTQSMHLGESNWFDPYDQRKKPFDNHGHGTNVAGLLVESQYSNRTSAIAPGVKIMAARIFNDEGLGHVSAVHRSFEWLLDPDGDPQTQDTPDIVNNAWGLGNTVGRCDLEFASTITLFRAAGIHMVFAAGNNGPTQGTSLSPANNPGAISVGGLASDGTSVWRKSSRGPSACDSGTTYPTVLAPSQNIDVFDKVALTAGEPARVQGTSFATALVSGMLAILRNQKPDASLEEIEGLLANGAKNMVEGVAVAKYHGNGSAIAVVPPKKIPETHIENSVSAKDMSYVAVGRQPIQIQLIDSQLLDKNKVMIDSISKPAFGGLTKINADKTITFIPRENFFGRDYFTYVLKDSQGELSRRGVVTILVRK